VTNVVVTDGMGNNIVGMDDVIFPGATAGTIYVADTAANVVYAITLADLDPNAPIASLGSFHELGIVDLATGVATPLVTGADLPDGTFTGPHGMDFIRDGALEIKVHAFPWTLWPPNGKMVNVTVFGTIAGAASGVKENSAQFALDSRTFMITVSATRWSQTRILNRAERRPPLTKSFAGGDRQRSVEYLVELSRDSVVQFSPEPRS